MNKNYWEKIEKEIDSCKPFQVIVRDKELTSDIVCVDLPSVKSFLKQTLTQALEEQREEILKAMNDLQNGLIDRPTNFGMNESYRCALDDVRQAMKVLSLLSPK